MAQQAPPINVDVDENGVDLVSGNFVTSITEGSIGRGEGAVSYVRARNGQARWIDNWSGGLVVQSVGGVSTAYVLFGEASDAFSVSGSTYTSKEGNGSTLVSNVQGFLYTASDGTKIQFNSVGSGAAKGYPLFGYSCLDYATTCSIPVSITKPNGLTFTLNWTYAPKCTSGSGASCVDPKGYYRFAGVTSSAGYGFTINYVTNAPGTFAAPVSDWSKRTSIVFSNSNNPATPAPTVTYPTPSSYFPDFTDPAGRSWHFVGGDGWPLTGIQRPGASSTSTVITLAGGTTGYVSSITRDGVTTSYSRTVSGTTATTTITDAQSNQTIVVADLSKGRVTQRTRVLGSGNLVTAYSYDTAGRPTEVSYPQGNKVQYEYDARGNVTKTRLKARAISGVTTPADIVSSASYPTTCTAPSCNRPDTTTDPRGNVTNYSYDPTTGLPVSVTAPAPTGSGTRPQTRYSYTANAAGVALLTGVSQCRTGAAPSCVGTVDETKQTISYNSNLLPQTVTSGAGDNSLVASQSFTYDSRGNILSVDGPLPGSDDVTIYRYDAADERVGMISADPDGAGVLKRRAVKATYNADGQITTTEVGTVDGTTDTDWSAFVSLQQKTSSYDANARKVRDVVTAGGSTYSVSEYSYDTLGRPDCAATRMNNSLWGTPLAACTLATAGTAGPDRITRTSYDELGRVKKVQTAYGTADQSDEVANAYTDNGKLLSVNDAENNKTTYEYDGFDRLWKTHYPSTTKGSGTSSTSDVEQVVYAPLSNNVASRILRDGNVINYGYDNLDRLVTKDLPGLHVWEFDVTYAYDNMGRLISAVDTNTHADRFTYDALGRRLSEGTDHFGSKTFQYDLAGRRTRMTWRDGFYVDYDYDNANEMTAIRENGATSGVGVLATFAYDDLGRRTSLTRGNGTVTSYSYDSASRLASLTQDLAGSAYDFTNGFSYNPASQIASATHSNDTYAWNEHYNVDRSYAPNGLNQLTTAGSTALEYDGRGNLTSSGSSSYGYTSQNLLASAPAAQLAYDGLGRLYYSGTTDLWHDYDGGNLVDEIRASTNTINRRYVFGPGTDEPLVWYEGSGTTDRRWLHADERGSVVAVTDASGSVISNGINRYDEYGIPSSTNIGRFQYTGQAWLPELGMSYYKARIYSPTLGRFMQTDPIGYGDGMNMYGYVGGDPVNFVDPSGLDSSCDVDNRNCVELGNAELVVIGGGSNFGGFDMPWWWSSSGLDLPWLGIGGSDGSNQPTSTILDTLKNAQKSLCRMGNAGAALSDKLGDASLATTGAGLTIGGAGIILDNPIMIGGGAAAVEAGGAFGLASGGLQIAAGFSQGIGSGNLHNALAGLVSLGSGVFIGKALEATIPRGWSPAAKAGASSNNSVTGNITGALIGLADWLKPNQVECPK